MKNLGTQLEFNFPGIQLEFNFSTPTPSSSFTIGDKVKVIETLKHTSNKAGDKGIITEIHPKHPWLFRVTVKDRNDFANWQSSHQLIKFD